MRVRRGGNRPLHVSRSFRPRARQLATPLLRQILPATSLSPRSMPHVGEGDEVPVGEVWACGVPTTVGDALATSVAKSASTTGDAAATGLACLVSTRSAASCVSTLGAIVTTCSFGGDEERVNSRARRRLASKAPAATNAFVRFKRGPHHSHPASHRR